MLTPQSFVTCVADNLKKRGFHHKRIKELTTAYEARVQSHIQAGKDPTSAGTLAMTETFENISRATQEAAKRTSAMLAKQAENIKIVREGLTVNTSLFMMDGKKGGPGTALARAAVSLIESDPRFSSISYVANKDVMRGQLYALFDASLEKVGKGAFGRQKGKASMDNIVREIRGERTGDIAAKEFADAWLKVQDLTVDLFNQAGGSMRKLDRYIPQSTNSVKLALAGQDVYVKAAMRAMDWNTTRWPDGTMIDPAEREGFLKEVYNTLASNGASKIDPKAFRGRGKAVGNQLETHRLLHYKDAQSWLDMHKQFGDGSVFDVFIRHVEDMSHRIALIETFGPNPEMTMLNVSSMVRKEASKLSGKEQAKAEAVLKNKFEPMFETIMRENPMDPHSVPGAIVTGTANILTSAQLGSASFLAIPGDFMQTVAVRAINNMGLFGGIKHYIGAIATDQKFAREISTQSGFVMDNVVMSTYSQTRYTGLATYGPAVTRRIAEGIMRLSLLSGHTRSARWAVQAEFMGLMNRMRSTAFADLPFRRVMERYGITPDEWNALRTNVQAWRPKQGVEFLRPIDVLNTQLPNRQSLYRKFQAMIYSESQTMVPEATIEGAVALKNTTRPDTLVGALLYSFAMYKNFPVSFAMIYGRLGMTAPTVRGRMAFYAGLGAGMTMVGALGTQLREISRGRDPLPMDNAAFMGKAFLSGGALSIWGDFLFSGINQYGKGPQDATAGPLVSFLGDTSQLLLGDVWQVADNLGSLSDPDFKSTSLSNAVEYAKRYTPGTSLWWARLALERHVFDRMTEIADPQAYRKRRNRVKKQKKDYGNSYWWAPGDRAPDRAPQL
jgi:hypothetical protein